MLRQSALSALRFGARPLVQQPRMLGVRNAAVYKKSHADGTAAELEWSSKTIALMAGTILALGGTYSYLMSHPRSSMETAAKYDPRSKDDQHKRPANEADAARVRTHQAGAPLSKNI
ncbi:hypothetical protein OQA88_9529 [Cercophora sp. LCS_1]